MYNTYIIVPTVRFASTIEEPSSGSKATENPDPPQSISVGFSSEEATLTFLPARRLFIMTDKITNRGYCKNIIVNVTIIIQ